MNRSIAFLGGLLLALMLFVGCNFAIPKPDSSSKQTSILVAAAASLQNTLEEIDSQFETANPGITVHYNFAASGPLQQQIQQGAPVDVFISAASQQMDTLQKQDLILGETRRNLLTNRLVLIVPSGSKLGITELRQLTNSNVQKISIGEPRSVPVGQYTEEVFKNLGILPQVRSKLVYGNSVRSVLSNVESGNADAGIVYLTDAKLSDRIQPIATVPKHLHSSIVYPIAVIRASRNPQAARAYVQFLQGQPTQKIFRKYGFGTA